MASIPRQSQQNPQQSLFDNPAITAMEELTRQISRLSGFISDQNEKIDQMNQMTANQKVGQATGHSDQVAAQVQQQRKTGADYNLKEMSLTQTVAAFKELLDQEQPGRPGRVRRTLGEFAVAGGVSANASVPSEVGGTPMGQASSQGGSGNSFGLPSETLPQGSGAGHGTLSQTDVLTMAMLGEHGGPAFVRNMAMESYGLQRQLNWGTRAAQAASNNSFVQNNAIPGLNPTNMNALAGAANVAYNNPVAAYAAYKVGTGIISGLGKVGVAGDSMMQLGADLGESAQGVGGRYPLGIHNPLSFLGSSATGVGAAAEVIKQQLQGRIPGSAIGMGAGLSGTEAEQTVGSIMGQGFGGNQMLNQGYNTSGDISTLSNFMAPLLKSFQGLSPEDLGQFLPYLRNAGTSTTQLTQSLNDLGEAAKATKETVGQAASSMIAFNQETEGMGSNQGGLNAAQSFRNVTGLDPQILGQVMQNPIFQGLAMSQYGVLPSGLRDLNGGALTGLNSQMLTMLMHATSGLHRPVRDPRTGQILESGMQRQQDQVAQMMGIDPSIVRRMWDDRAGIAARTATSQYSTEFQNMYNAQKARSGGTLTHADVVHDQRFWNQYVRPSFAGTGIGSAEMDKLSNMGFKQRISGVRNALDVANQKDKWNQIQNNPNKQTVQITLSGQAAKIFGLKGPSGNKVSANAGGTAINVPVNSTQGDTSPAATMASSMLSTDNVATMLP